MNPAQHDRDAPGAVLVGKRIRCRRLRRHRGDGHQVSRLGGFHRTETPIVNGHFMLGRSEGGQGRQVQGRKQGSLGLEIQTRGNRGGIAEELRRGVHVRRIVGIDKLNPHIHLPPTRTKRPDGRQRVSAALDNAAPAIRHRGRRSQEPPRQRRSRRGPCSSCADRLHAAAACL
jgi:hypothetical protein